MNPYGASTNPQHQYYQTPPNPQYYQWQPQPPPQQQQQYPPAPPRAGWQDPRLQALSTSAHHAQPYPYSQNVFGQAQPQTQIQPSQQQYQYQIPHYDADTSSWSMKHNHHQQDFDSQQLRYDYPQTQHDSRQHQDLLPKPPLPPRPSSTNASRADLASRLAESQHPVQSPNQPVAAHPDNHAVDQSRQSWRESFYTQALAQDAVPAPPPPPRPAEYQARHSQDQYNAPDWPHEHYSNQPSTHHYEPQIQQVWHEGTTAVHTPDQQQPSRSSSQYTSSQLEQSQPLVDNQTPLSADDKQHTRWDSSSSGIPTTPQPPISHSYYQSYETEATTSDRVQDPGYEVMQTLGAPAGKPSSSNQHSPINASKNIIMPSELYSSFASPKQRSQAISSSDSAAARTRSSESQNFISAMPIDQKMAQTLPVPDFRLVPTKLSQPENQPYLSHDVAGTAGGSASPRQGSVSSVEHVKRVERAGTIDSVIQAWNAPLSQPEPAPPKSPAFKVADREQAVSPPSYTQSPDLAVQTLNLPARSTPGNSHASVQIAPAADVYKDLDPLYHSSLTRYVKMLRQEASASSDDEKFKVFSDFVQKELGIRHILYGVDVKPPFVRSPSQTQRLPAMPTLPEAGATGTVNQTPLAKSVSQIKRKSLRSGPTDSANTRSGEAKELSRSVVENSGDERPLHGGAIANSPGTLPEAGFSPVKASGFMEPRPFQPPHVTSDPPSHELHPQKPDKDDFGFRSDRDVAPPSVDQAQSISMTATPPMTGTSKLASNSPGSNDDSYVVVGHDDEDGAYSAGGRPRIPKTRPEVSNILTSPISGRAPPPVAEPAKIGEPVSPSNNAPMVIEDYAVVMPTSPSANAPITLDSQMTPTSTPMSPMRSSFAHTNPTVKFEPPRPPYTPFLCNEASPEDGPTLLSDRPADEAYSHLRNSAAESGRLLTHEMARGSSPGDVTLALSPTKSQREHQETFLGLLRSQSKAFRSNHTPPSASVRPRQGTPLSTVTEQPVIDALSALHALLPRHMPLDGQLHPRVAAIIQKADAFPDDFGYIKESVISWDRSNREVRRQQDEERERRQQDSEAHLDDLFNAHEISYADIGPMEADLKLVEAEQRYEEDQQELQSFIESVFTPVTERNEYEIGQLMPQYVLAIDMLDLSSDSASRFLNVDRDRVQMSEAMTNALYLFKKLEIRYLKLAEARFERERRRKRLELTVLYTNGNKAGVEKLEEEFANAEKLQVLHEAQDRDTRANKLMDTFDRATVRGLGDNQTFVDDVLTKIRKLHNTRIKEGAWADDNVFDPNTAQQTMALAHEALDFVLTDSRTILTTSNAADTILNDADYAVSVAEARLANADEAMFKKLGEDKSREDRKIAEEMAVRMDSMAKGPAQATLLIQDLVAQMSGDPKHGGRMKIALEAAKKRNAVKES